ncbi:unnamed protein product, partial [Protopolystoma xenopodis]
MTIRRPTDPFACRPGEQCYTLSDRPGLGDDASAHCFVSPCFPRAVCINSTLLQAGLYSEPAVPFSVSSPHLVTSTSASSATLGQNLSSGSEGGRSRGRGAGHLLDLLPPGMRHLEAPLVVPPAGPGCRPNAARLTNSCALLRLRFDLLRLPYGVKVGDVCHAVRHLPSLRRQLRRAGGATGAGDSSDATGASMGHKGASKEVKIPTRSLGMSCDVEAETPERNIIQ